MNFPQVRNEFYADTQGVMLVYDVTNRSSFEALNGWLKEMRMYMNSASDMDAVVFIVCANKVSSRCYLGTINISPSYICVD